MQSTHVRLHSAHFKGCASISLALILFAAGCGVGTVTSQALTVPDEPVPAKSSKPADDPPPKKAAEPSAQATAAKAAPTPDAPPVAQEKERPPANAVLEHPFDRRIAVPDFPNDLEWLNVGGPLRKQDLKGKFVLLDFWTYCCINCMHILPELKKLERAYPNQLVVIGVHSAKFETEKGSQNIEEAILRYEIEHPVVNDADHKIWDTFGVRSWPTIILIDPEGNAVWGRGGEFEFAEVDEILKAALPYYRQKKTLDETPLRFEMLAQRQKATPLRFPGKVLADVAGQRLFIADSNHNRLVVAGLDGKLIATIGSGAIGRADGDFGKATFDHPQGMALHEQTLYVADTENHMLRKVDLEKRVVTTISGTGQQARGGWPTMNRDASDHALPDRWVGKPATTALNSPWDLWIHGRDLYIAMAGPHQIWKMPLDESEIGPYAGNGREDIVDGPLLPRMPYEQGFASFAQPSGLSADRDWLYVADSEGSSIRAVPFDPTKSVRTVVGSADLPFNRLFTFGDQDGDRDNVLLQHCLGVAHDDGQLFITDTYNNKIKIVDAKTGATKTLAGTGKPGYDDAAGAFDEPAGITIARGVLYISDTNNHQIRTVDPKTGKVGTFAIAGLQPPLPSDAPRTPDFSKSQRVAAPPAKLTAKDGHVQLNVTIALPSGWKINDQAPMRYWLEADGDTGAVARTSLGEKRVEKPATTFAIKLPVSGLGTDQVRVSLLYYYCQEGGEGLCKVGSIVFLLPLEFTATENPSSVDVKHSATEMPIP